MRKKALLVGVMGLVAMLAALGMWRDATPSRALIGLPIQPFNPVFAKSGLKNTELSVAAYAPAVTTDMNFTQTDIPRGLRIGMPWIFGASEFGIPADMDDTTPGKLGDIIATLDVDCDSTGEGDNDYMATTAGPTFPYDWTQTTTTRIAGTGPTSNEWLLSMVPPYPWILRHTAIANNFWVKGAQAGASVVLNTVYTTVPWSPNGTANTATTKNGGDPRLWGGGPMGTDSHCIDTPQDSVSRTSTGINPPKLGDSGGPCTGGNCADAGVYGVWTTIDTSGYAGNNITLPVAGTKTVHVNKNILDNGPDGGTFTDHWEIEVTNSTVMKAEWSAGVTAKDVTETLTRGDNVARVQDMLITCKAGQNGEGLVVVKNVLWPVAPTKDYFPTDNAALSVSRVVCGTAGAPLVDKQVLWIKPYDVTVDPETPALTTSPWQMNLMPGQIATVSLRELKANNSTGNVTGNEWLVAESSGISMAWDFDSVVQHPTQSTAPVVGGAGASLELTSVIEPAGQSDITADLIISCPATAGRYSVVVKAIDAPAAPLGEANAADNAQRVVIPVNCGTALLPIAGDTIDDGAGLYARWTIAMSNPDSRQTFSSPPSFPSDQSFDTKLQQPVGGFIERVVSLGCWWMDADGCHMNSDGSGSCDADTNGYLTATESQQDYELRVTLGGYDTVDPDHDCLIDPTNAQPGHAVDLAGGAGGADCASPVPWSGPPTQVTNKVNADHDCDGLLDGIEKDWGSDPMLPDSDLDGAVDYVEMFDFTSPVNKDTDADGFLDKPNGVYGLTNADKTVDNCPSVSNPDQINSDGGHRIAGVTIPPPPGFPGQHFASNPNKDKMGDACDPDDDNDGLPDTVELVTLTSPRGLDPVTLLPSNDTDGDHCVDGAEVLMASNPLAFASKCPGSWTDLKYPKFFRACRWNLPPVDTNPNYIYLLWNDRYTGPTYADRAEFDADNDGVNCITSGGGVGDRDNDSGPGNTNVDIPDIQEVEGYMTNPANRDTDGDGCEDFVQINDLNGDGAVNSTDLLILAQRIGGAKPVNATSDEIFDVNKDGAISVSGDLATVARNLCAAKSFGGCGQPACISNVK